MVTYISYWELNPDLDPSEIADVAQKIISRGLYPAEGVKELAWYVSTDYWGVSISEAESEEAIMNEVNMWRIAKPGMIRVFKSAIAMKSADAIPLMVKLAKKVKG